MSTSKTRAKGTGAQAMPPTKTNEEVPKAPADDTPEGTAPMDVGKAAGMAAARAALASKRKVESMDGAVDRIHRTSSKTSGTVVLVGTVTHTKSIMAGSTTKLEVGLAVEEVTAPGGAAAVVDFVQGDRGFEYLLPTSTSQKAVSGDAADVSPDGAKSSRKKAAAEVRQLALSANHIALSLHHVRNVSFYTTLPDGSVRPGFEKLAVGANVTVRGTIGKLSDDGSTVWLNASDCVTNTEPAAPGEVVERLLYRLQSEEIAAPAAVKLSCAMRGFFGRTFEGAQHVQAEAFRQAWVSAKASVINALRAKATHLRAENADNENDAVVLEADADALEQRNPADLAMGTPFFRTPRPVDLENPAYMAPIVVRGGDMPGWVSNMFDAPETMPSRFCAVEPRFCEVVGNLVNVTYKLTFVGNRDAAIDAMISGEDPFISHANVALCCKFSVRDVMMAHGIGIKAKADDITIDMFKHGDYFAIANIVPREASESIVSGVFANGYGFAMRPTLRKIGVLVSEDFVKTHLANGENSFNPPDNDPSTTMITERAAAGAAATGADGKPKELVCKLNIKTTCYKEVTTAGYTFNASKHTMPAHAPNKEWRVWWPESVSYLGEQKTRGTDTAAGEAAVAQAAAEYMASGKDKVPGAEDDDDGQSQIGKFLFKKGAVYVLAVSA